MSRERPLYDDEYVGPRWTYSMRYRPLTAWMPTDFIIQNGRPHPKHPHGTVDYPRQLTDEEVSAHELALVNSPPDPDDARQELDAERGGDGTAPLPEGPAELPF